MHIPPFDNKKITEPPKAPKPVQKTLPKTLDPVPLILILFTEDIGIVYFFVLLFEFINFFPYWL